MGRARGGAADRDAARQRLGLALELFEGTGARRDAKKVRALTG